MTTAPKQSTSIHFPRGIPRAARRHGKVLAPSLLEAGDLLLVARKHPGWVSRRIQESQEELFDWEHARWHHVAVCGGRTEVCEALLKGVRARQYWHYMDGEYSLKVRRLKEASAKERAMVAYYAATMSKTAYGIGALVSIKRYFTDNNPWKRSVLRSRGVVCSQLYFEACMRIGILLAELPRDRVSPAHLSASDQLVDLPLEWVSLRASSSESSVFEEPSDRTGKKGTR